MSTANNRNSMDPSTRRLSQVSPSIKQVTNDQQATKETPYPYPVPFTLNSNQTRPRNFYWKVSDACGFKGKYSLLFFIVFGGSMLGFCLSRLMMFSPSIVEHKTVPGEWFWYSQPLYKPNLFIHIYLTTLGGLLTGIQFLPAYQTPEWMTLHKINGVIILLFLIPGTITGAVVARVAFGGALHTQLAFWVVGIMIIVSACAGMSDLKEPGVHRQWMLRLVAYLGSIITARIIRHIAGDVITSIGTYYFIWTCEELAFLLGADSPAYKDAYPECAKSAVFAIVKASTKGGPERYGTVVRCSFGMSLWVAMVIHAIGVEVYIHLTPASNLHRTNPDHQYIPMW